jgi:hypothetical protein
MRFRLGNVLLVAMALALCSCATGRGLHHFGRATLHGIIYDARGFPLDRVRVSVDSPSAGIRAPVCSDVNGRFAVPSVSRGSLTVRTQKDGYEPLSTTVEFLERTRVLYLRMRSGRDVAQEAQRLLDRGRPDAAVEPAERAHEIAPDSAVIRYIAAVTHLRAGSPDRALELLRWFGEDGSLRAVSLLRARACERRNL